ncbi:probable inactive ATP-dependent zinc metalloprotease FTSHI 3, chloroplastic isoform X1 [Malania oleifera]|uniref:probable inactive ATP-dependent zinc metalloprotease FTSHI 3, chloroplastic isoform X1 n=1 Tax=Malania oleifera TaxID=397392 RepID=UPI0025ADD8AF|nr:probable inactive ATP-dependent zinc metalloprotease FTSHI 3, chloroplastic isoform X1 [Malania oleifera]XP_057970996.1 probable inactive ATP-dependent zinc metalloprotease FTSHI 3, chloroplastic isoform X1 [Malania oleifera]
MYKMASFSVVSNDGLLTTREKFKVHIKKNVSLGGCRGLGCSLTTPCCSSASSRSFGSGNCCKSLYRLVYNGKVRPLINGFSPDRRTKLGRRRLFERTSFSFPLVGIGDCNPQPGLFCNRIIRSVINGNTGDKETHSGKGGNGNFKKRFSFRLRPRLRLLSIRLRRFSAQSMLRDLGTFVRKNMRRLTISTSISVTLVFCYLFMNLAALPSPRIVPYSDLVVNLQNGYVSKVLFEEGSRRVYFNKNMNSKSVENAQMSEDKSLVVDVSNENVVDAVASDDSEGTGKIMNENVLRKFFKTRVSAPEWQYCTRKIDHDENFLLGLMREKGIIYSSAPQSLFMSIRSILVTVLTLWIPLTPLMWLLYRQLSSANSPARKRRPSSQMISFDDVEGVDAAKVELMEIVLCMQGAINYNKLGAKLPRGVLLVGPPGTGKTLLARAVAGEAGVPFFTVSASEFVELFVGRGAARIRDLFNVARKCSPSIIFIDELDAVGGKRGRSFNDERDQTLNQLLTEMDGFELDMKVVVIAATNRPEALDPALCRPGRFSRKVLVGEPDEDGRRKILAVHLRGVPLEEDACLICNLVASLTQGLVGADLANIVNEAALLAARRGGETVTREDIMEAVERAKFGINRQPNPNAISKEVGKLFPWMPSLLGRNPRQDGLPWPIGYQTLS